MAQAKRKNNPQPVAAVHLSRGLREGSLFILGAIGIYLLVCLAGYEAADPGWSHSGSGDSIHNPGGVVGAIFADAFLYLFGLMAYLFPLAVIYSGWILFHGREHAEEAFEIRRVVLRVSGFVLTLGSGAGLATLHIYQPDLALPLNPGGVLGDVVGNGLVSAFSFLGTTLFLLALFLTGITLLTGLSWFWLMDITGQLTLRSIDWLQGRAAWLRDYLQGRRARRAREDVVEVVKEKQKARKPPRIEPVINLPEPSERGERERQVPLFDTSEETPLPPVSLLDVVDKPKSAMSKAALEAMSQLVENKLRDFGIEVEVVAVHPGPVITRFELQPAAGVKVSQISNLAKDLARALSTVSVRIVEVIPGKSVIGLEVPNETREIVRLSEIINSKAYDSHDSNLSLAMGKDIAGYPV
ncbi:MAG: DNA translocase FtsK 4TM domain-containing protein, partial [Granulosicoccaceae bacterium]